MAKRFAKGLFAVTIFAGSAGVVQKYGGDAAVAVYAFIVAAISAVLPLLVNRGYDLLTRRTALTLAALTFVGLCVAMIVIYPHANVHVAGQGTDRDDAADLGATALMHGRTPYHQETYLGQPISQLPGALLLAVPFVAVTGHSAYAALVWLALLFLIVVRLANVQTALLVSWAVMLLSPGFWRELLTGGDLVSNTAYVTVAVALVYAVRESRVILLVVSGAWLGLTLSSRLNLALLLVPLGVALWRTVGLPRSAACLTAAVVVGAAVTVPLVALGGGHSPFAVADKLTELNQLFRHAHEAALVTGFAAAALVALRTRVWTLPAILWQGAAIQVLFTIELVVADSVHTRTLDFSGLVSGYGVFALLLLVPAVGALLGLNGVRIGDAVQANGPVDAISAAAR